MPYQSSADAELAGISLNDELIKAMSDVGVLEQAMHELKRKKLDLDESIRKGRLNIKKLQIEIAQARTYFFNLKRDNL